MPGPDELDLALIAGAARAAGEIARGYWRKSPKVWDKGEGHGPVTEADLAINGMLEARLRGARPGYGWLSEETPDTPDRLAARRVFVLDPLDGTRAFIEGDKTFAHSIAVIEDGAPVAAAVYLPVHGLMFTASADGPALLNDAPIHPSQRISAEGATVLTSRAALAPEHWQDDSPPAVRREFRASLAYRLCLVAEGRFDAMLTLRPTWEWDIAAGDLIARRAGAHVTDRTGAALRFNATDPRANGVVAGAPGVHGALLAQLRPAGDR